MPVETRRWGKFEVSINDGHCELPQGLTSVPNRAFRDWDGEGKGCKALVSIAIPSSVTEIGNSAFAHCSSLESAVIPSSVTEIGGFAFAGCSSLQSVVDGSQLGPISRQTRR